MRRLSILGVLIVLVSPLMAQEPVDRPVMTLEYLQAEALKNNPEILKARTSLESARAEWSGARSARLPRVEGSADFSWISNPLEPVVIKSGELGDYQAGGVSTPIPMEDTVVWEGMEDTWYRFSLKITQPVFTWGKINGGIRARKAALDAAELELLRTEKRIMGEITVYWYSFYLTTLMEAVLVDQTSKAGRLIVLAEEGWKKGFLLKTEYLDARIKASETEMAAAELKDARNQAMLGLEELTGIDGLADAHLEFSGPLLEPEAWVLPPEEELLQNAQLNNLELKLLEKGELAAAALLDMERGHAPWKPDIGLELELSYAGSRFPLAEKGWYTTNRENLVLSFGLKTTIFDPGRISQKKVRSSGLTEAGQNRKAGWTTLKKTLLQNLYGARLSLERITWYRLKRENHLLVAAQKEKEWSAGLGSETVWLSTLIEADNLLIEEYREWSRLFTAWYLILNLTEP